MHIRLVFLAVAGLALSACAVSKEKYEAAHVALEGSPKLKAMIVADCAERTPRWSTLQRKQIAALMNVSESSAGRVLCQRAINGVASGRLTYDDYLTARSGGVTPKLIRVLQGR